MNTEKVLCLFKWDKSLHQSLKGVKFVDQRLHWKNTLLRPTMSKTASYFSDQAPEILLTHWLEVSTWSIFLSIQWKKFFNLTYLRKRSKFAFFPAWFWLVSRIADVFLNHSIVLLRSSCLVSLHDRRNF